MICVMRTQSDSTTGILPGGILAALQFLPVLRHKVIWFHRINGWVVTLLLMVGTDSQTVKGNEADRHLAQVSNAGAIMILRRAMGGRYDTLVFGGILGIFTTVSAWMGIINIKLKQIDQHRKWMMRTWVYAASIIVSEPSETSLSYSSITRDMLTSFCRSQSLR